MTADLIDPTRLQSLWDRLAPPDFAEADLHPVRVDGFQFKKLHLPRGDEPSPVRIRLGPSLYGVPRFAAYRYRLVLLSKDVVGGSNRWEIGRDDILNFIHWARHARHVITFSTLKSGASFPLSLHAQSFPLKSGTTLLSALTEAGTKNLVRSGTMPRFQSIAIDALVNYPLRGIKITGEDHEVAGKLFEMALNYDHLKTFNLVIVPNPSGAAGEGPSAFFFPRRKDGLATFHMNGNRWQIAALEANGLMQAKTEKDFSQIDEPLIRQIFDRTGLMEVEFHEFLKLLETF